MQHHDIQTQLWSDQLRSGLIELELQLSATQSEQLLAFLGLLVSWNRAYNLTAVRDPGKLVTRHLLDSLSLLPYLVGPNLVDVGTGAGIPGIPLAIARPNWTFFLLDSNSKKTRFVNQVRLALGLSNLTVVHCRVERWHSPLAFQTITSRAFASLPRMYQLTSHLGGPDTVWAAMKGPAEAEERAGLPTEVEVEVRDIQVPGETACRRLVLLRRAVP